MKSSIELNDHAEDSATLRRLGIAIGCMCLGALMLVAAAVTVSHLLG
jgi:hypothetical protein